MIPQITYYNTDCILGMEKKEESFQVFEAFPGNPVLSRSDQSEKLESLCIQLKNALAVRLYGDLDTF